jgi:hypothetical protein
MSEEIVFLTFEEAEKMLPNGDKDEIHTFRQMGNLLVGMDFSKQYILDLMNKYCNTVQLSGETATSMGHGIVLEDDKGYLFIESSEGE